jgi:hypothetical protein
MRQGGSLALSVLLRFRPGQCVRFQPLTVVTEFRIRSSLLQPTAYMLIRKLSRPGTSQVCQSILCSCQHLLWTTCCLQHLQQRAQGGGLRTLDLEHQNQVLDSYLPPSWWDTCHVFQSQPTAAVLVDGSTHHCTAGVCHVSAST